MFSLHIEIFKVSIIYFINVVFKLNLIHLLCCIPFKSIIYIKRKKPRIKTVVGYLKFGNPMVVIGHDRVC